MDSLTQIVLGAACGEVALGRKVGNRAMFWGAIGGTIPDLDVLSNLVTDEMTALAFHRAITHSLFFSIVAPPLLGWLVHQIYEKGIYRRHAYRLGFSLFWFLLIGLPIGWIAFEGGGNVLSLISGAVIPGLLGFLLWRYYIRREPGEVKGTVAGWALVFYLAIGTHPLLDSCTAYGTQLFQPFSDYRVAWNNISVVDPLYTLPFLLFLIMAGRQRRGNRMRSFYNWAGLGVSSLYLAFTFVNKQEVNRVFESSLEREGYRYERYMTSPTIFNNILWQGLAEGDTAYYHGFYSLLDDSAAVLDFNIFPKNHELLAGHETDREVAILRWFSKDYYNVLKREDGSLQLNDLRFGLIKDKYERPEDYIFRFNLRVDSTGEMRAKQTREGAAFDGETFKEFFKRIGGK